MDELTLSAANTKLGQIERPISPRRVRWMQRRVKQVWGWSARRMAERLGISRAHLKRIESGTRAPSEMFCLHFRNLERELVDQARQEAARSKQVVTITSKFQLPAHLEILSEPRKCRGCRKWFVPRTPNQTMHTTAACRQAARRKGRGK